MKQLMMYWKNDGTKAIMPTLPNGVTLTTFDRLENAKKEWLDIAIPGKLWPDELNNLPYPVDFYREFMTAFDIYTEDKCFFLLVNGECAATITILCDYKNSQGLVHMVSCKPEFRGMGLGNLLTEIGLYVLKNEGLKTALLRTDDWRIPAIKTYLKAGFTPDLTSSPDYKERWDAIFKIING
jgi:ribosomal protein S18 acetylase RimI-like enzyme